VRGVDPYQSGFGEERDVPRNVIRSKIHRATVTGADLDYLSPR
jgi:hypothetical protein